jgi:hypothetical protein
MTYSRRGLAASALVLGALAAIVRTPAPPGPPVDVAALARTVEREDDHVTAVELAAWIKDRKPGLRVIDVRSAAEFDSYHVPTAERMALDALVTIPFTDEETLVLYSDGGSCRSGMGVPADPRIPAGVFPSRRPRGLARRGDEPGARARRDTRGARDVRARRCHQPVLRRHTAPRDGSGTRDTDNNAAAERYRGDRAHAEARVLTARRDLRPSARSGRRSALQQTATTSSG